MKIGAVIAALYLRTFPHLWSDLDEIRRKICANNAVEHLSVS